MRAAMGKVTALMMDTITDKSGHTMTGLAVSVCVTPAAPAPLPIPYPTVASVSEGVIDECMRTKIEDSKILTVGGCTKNCHGNEPGTLKEVVSLNTAGPCFPILGAPIVLIELGMAGITLSPGFMNKNPVPGGGSSASGAGGGGSGGGGAGGGGAAPPGQGPTGGSNGGGGGGGSSSAAAPPSPPAPPTADGQASAGHPVDVISGSMFTGPLVDFQLTGFFWLSFTRAYQTSAVEHDVGLGHGWSHALAWRVERRGAGLVLIDDQQRRIELPPMDPGAEILLPYGSIITRRGDDFVVDLQDGLLRVLRPSGTGRWGLAELRDDRGHTATIEWRDGRVVGMLDAVGRRVSLESDDRFHSFWATATDGEGKEHKRRLVTYEIDDKRDLVGVVDGGGGQTRYEYDDRHYLVRETRADGLRYHFVYADVGGVRRCTETWGDLEGAEILVELGSPTGSARGIHHAKLEYGPGPFESRVTDAVGAIRRYRGNAFGLVEHFVDPAGYVSTYHYDDVGRLVAHTDAAGRSHGFAYGSDGRLATQSGPGGSVRLQYEGRSLASTRSGPHAWSGRSEGGRLVEETLPGDRKFSYARDEHGLVKALTRPDGTTIAYARDAHGNVKTATDSAVGATSYVFDVWGRPTRIVAPGGAETSLDYDSAGYLVRSRISGPDGHGGSLERVAEYAIDVMGRIRAQRLPGGGEIAHRFVGDCLVGRTLPGGATTRLGYDALLRLVWAENAAGERMTRSYDARGLLAEETTFAGLATRFEYDAAGRPVVLERGDGNHVRATRSRAGGITTVESSGGARTSFEYDDGGSITRATSGAVDVQLTWDAAGRLASETQVVGGWRFRVDYEYDEAGRFTGHTCSTDWSTILHYDERGLTDRVSLIAGDEARAEVALSRDEAGRITGARHAGDESPLAGYEVDRDALGMPTRISVLDETGKATRTRRYTFAASGAVADVADDLLGGRRYELDPSARPTVVSGLGAEARVGYTAHGTAVPTSGSWSVGPGGRPTKTENATLLWDKRGRLAEKRTDEPTTSWTYGWSDEDRLVSARRGDGRTVQMLYDAFGRRVARIVDGQSTFYGWAGDSAVEVRGTDGESTRRVFGLDEYTPILEQSDEVGARLFASDGASTPWAAIPPRGPIAEIDLGPFGATSRRVGDFGDLRFAGQTADDVVGLHYNRHRWYAPDLHVYLSPDPLGILGSDQDVGFLGNVTFIVDPLGLWVAIIHGMDDNKAIDPSVAAYQNGAPPGSRVVRYDQLAPGSLAGATQVIVVTHGAPGSLAWGKPGGGTRSVNGEQLGDMLNNAGFDGTAPGAKVDVAACNGGTPGLFGGNSVAQGVSNRTLADASGARANNRVLGALSLQGTTRTGGPNATGVGSDSFTGVTPNVGEYTSSGNFVTVSPQPANR